MRIHTNYLIERDLHNLLGDSARPVKDVTLHVQSVHGSRSHSRAFEVALRGHGTRHTKRPNTGITGANSSEYAATYDDWGWLLASLFQYDPNATAGPYKGRANFHRQTGHNYV